MSTVAPLGPSCQAPEESSGKLMPRSEPAAGAYVRRRGSLQQGRALETLGHAVEYLIDGALFQLDPADTQANQAAVQILMRLSRAVFLECPEVLPVRRRLQLWSRRMVARGLRRNPAH